MSLDFFDKLAERKVQEAVDEGLFDNLPVKGKPLTFDEPTGIPYAEMVANKIMQNAGVLPEWMQTQKDLEAEQNALTKLRAHLIAENRKRHTKIAYLPADHIAVTQYFAWHTHSLTLYHHKRKQLNSLTLKLSLVAPSTVTVPGLCNVEEEIKAFSAEFPLISEERLAPPSSPTK